MSDREGVSVPSSHRDEHASVAAESGPDGALALRRLARALETIATRGTGATATRCVLQAIAEQLGGERVALFRLRESGGFEVLAAAYRDGEPLPAPASRVSHYAIKRAMTAGEPLFVSEARSDRRYRAEESLDGKRPARSILVLPIRYRGELYGGVYVDHRFQTVTLAPDDLLALWRTAFELLVVRRNDGRAADMSRETTSASEESPVARDLEQYLRPAETEDFHGFVSANPDLRDAFETLRRVAESDLPVVLHGETGTGKSLLARGVHASSARSSGAFATVQCASIPDTLVESELFGHVRGAFTGADADRVGVVTQADGGTVVLDGVGDAGPEFQTKVLRVLEHGLVRPIGAKDAVRVDVRVVSVARRHLSDLVELGSFRRDLYYRLKGIEFEIPPLRDRREDIRALGEFFLRRESASLGREAPRITREAWLALVRHDWPGNVRELENEVRRLVALGVDPIAPESLVLRSAVGERDGELTLDGAVSAAERRVVAAALQAAGGNKSRAAQQLQITRKSLYRRMKKYGLS